MKRIAIVLSALLLVCAVIGASCVPKKRSDSAFHFGEFAISRTGLLSIEGQSAQYRLVPRDKYPAELRGIAIIDLAERTYVARFFEPSGIGVEGFFDICFQLRHGRVFSGQIMNAGSLERINGVTYIRSCAYVFDSEKRVLLKVDTNPTNSMAVSLAQPLEPFQDQ
jgi:hypothetical protein